MATRQASVGDLARNASNRSDAASASSHSDGNPTLTPAERWLQICDNVYARAQKREFVGGNPLQDLADAEQEVDAAYETDFKCVFSLTTTAEITEQLKGLFACYGVEQDLLDNLLDGHQEGLERLAAMNRDLASSASEFAIQQTEVLKGVASEAVATVQSFAEGRLRPEGVLRIAELSMQSFGNALAGCQRLSR